MNEAWILLWALAGIVLLSVSVGVLAGAGMIVGFALILAPGSPEEAWATLQDGGGRLSTWLRCTFAHCVQEENG